MPSAAAAVEATRVRKQELAADGLLLMLLTSRALRRVYASAGTASPAAMLLKGMNE